MCKNRIVLTTKLLKSVKQFLNKKKESFPNYLNTRQIFSINYNNINYNCKLNCVNV